MAKKRKTGGFNLNQAQKRDIYAIALATLSLFTLISILGYGGAAGVYVDKAMTGLLGIGVYLLPVMLLSLAMMLLIERWRNLITTKGPGLLAIFLSVVAIVHLSAKNPFNPATIGQYGGYVGAIISYAFLSVAGKVGAYILLSAFLLVGVVVTAGISLADTMEEVISQGRLKMNDFRRSKRRDTPDQPRVERQRKTEASSKVGTDSAERIAETIRIEETKLVSSSARSALAAVKDEAYQFPPLDLLKMTSPRTDKAWKKGVNERIKTVEDTLRDFGVDAAVAKVVKGPTVTRFELQLASGVKVNRIMSLSNDLALALAASDVRILAPIPGKSLVGIEVPSDDKQMVTLGDVLTEVATIETPGPLLAGLGKSISGRAVSINLGAMPHLLISGATGSGKTTCVNSIITSLLFFSHPDVVKMILIDPKMVELTHYNNMPHLLAPVITKPRKASQALAWTVKEMERRFKAMSETGARNIEYYNDTLPKGTNSMPYLVIVIDELADLMMVAPAEVEESICRVSQMGRAVGINLVVATQRPSVDVITGLIKANIPSRISFEVASQMDSRVILDMPGAEKLIGRGDMLFLPAGTVKPERIQGAYLSEKEIADVTGFVRAQREPDFDDELLIEEGHGQWSTVDYIDPLLDQAIEVVVRSGQASISMLQRRLRVGYSRAARLVDTMEERGIVGGADGSRARAVLLSEDEFERLQSDET